MNLELGTWNLELGTWNSELGTRNSELGTTHNVTSALPHVNPPPNATSSTVSPGLARPSRIASSSAMGTDAADVLP